MADWEEVKRLAADFQKVQLSSNTQRLSERNCIEIVTWLIQKKMVELIFSSDGKEYITPAQLVQDIKGELYDNRGRVNLVELSKSLGVDLAHINAHLNDILKGQKDIQLVLGQLIDTSYISKIASEINEKLQLQGQINVSDLTISYDLPAEFLQTQVIEKHLGKIIDGKQDKNDARVIFTESFVSRCKAKIKGALAGITKPTAVTAILNQIGLSEKLFFSLFDQVNVYGSLTNRLAGGQYVPNVYSRSQNEWVTNFYKQNGYLEFDSLTRLGITDYKTYLKKQLDNDDLFTLNSCVVSKRIIESLEADIDECILSNSFVDVQNNLPSVFTEQDIENILKIALTKPKQAQVVVIENYIISKSFIDDLGKSCEDLLAGKAKTVVENGKYQQYITDLKVTSNKSTNKNVEIDTVDDRREERKKKSSGSNKILGGSHGREIKTKSTKKISKQSSKIAVDDDDSSSAPKKAYLQIITEQDVRERIENKLEDEGLQELTQSIVEFLLPQLNEKSLEIAANVYATTITDKTTSRRKTHNDVQNKINNLLGDVRLFERGIKIFPGDLQAPLYKYLLRTVCTDVVNELLDYVASEEGKSVDTSGFTHEQRLKLTKDLCAQKNEYSKLQPLVKSLTASNTEEFSAIVEEALEQCSMIIKKIDKKKDRAIVMNHRRELLEQLEKCDDPALVLHLATLAIFTAATQNMLHASGRHVTAILGYLKQFLSSEQSQVLSDYHNLVTAMLSGGPEAEEAKVQLADKMQSVKTIANEYKKTSDKN